LFQEDLSNSAANCNSIISCVEAPARFCRARQIRTPHPSFEQFARPQWTEDQILTPALLFLTTPGAAASLSAPAALPPVREEHGRYPSIAK
jgi:hypothetical protein